jgi:hypothetical protein
MNGYSPTKLPETTQIPKAVFIAPITYPLYFLGTSSAAPALSINISELP